MHSKKNFIGKVYAIIIFSIFYIFPLYYMSFNGKTVLSGNIYVKKAYIQSSEDVASHFLENFSSYINLISNPIFIFFVSAVLVQKLMIWIKDID